MKKITYMPSRQKGLTLIEMMVAMAISLVIVIAAAYVWEPLKTSPPDATPANATITA